MLGEHKKKARTSNLLEVSEELAQSVSMHLDFKLIPYGKLCVDCHPKLLTMINKARYEESIPPNEDFCTSSGAQDSQLEDYTTETESEDTDKEIILKNIKENLQNFSKEEKAAIVSVLPSSWTISEICEKTDIGRRLVLEVRNGGAKVQRKQRNDKLSPETLSQIKEFYLDSKNSKILPGIKDVVSVKTPDGRVKERKQLLLSSISEAHEQFVAETGSTISLETFRRHRPKNVVLVGTSGTHTICCCVLCENPKLLITTSILGKIDHTGYNSLVLKRFCSIKAKEIDKIIHFRYYFN